MLLTIANCTARKEPKFDWLADSIVHAMEFCPLPVELIVVDKLLWDVGAEPPYQQSARRGQLDDAVKGRFSYRHTPPKPTAWQGPWRKTKGDLYALCNARNTAIAMARGQHIILVDDCTVVDDLWLQCHARAAMRRICLAGSFRSYTTATVENGRVTDGKLHPRGEDARGEVLRKCDGSWMYGLNTSFPLEAALKVSGYDEKFDGQGGVEDCDFGMRVAKAGYNVVYMPSCRINQILETHEPVCGTAGWDQPQPRRQKELMLADGRNHFANEMLIQEWYRKPSIEPRGNDFDLKALRRNALLHGYDSFPTTRAVETDWRDNESLSVMR